MGNKAAGKSNKAATAEQIAAPLGLDIVDMLAGAHLAGNCSFIVIADHLVAAYRRQAVVIIARGVLPHRLVTDVRAQGTLGPGAGVRVLDGIEAHSGAGIPVLHWFSGSPRNLDRAIKLGCWFSVCPAMLNGERGRSLAERMPRERVLTESDGPFAQIDGRAVLPWQFDKAVLVLADLWGRDRHETQNILNDNLRSLTQSLGAMGA